MTPRWTRRLSATAVAICASLGLAAPSFAAAGDDPLRSIMWTEMKAQFFGDAKVVFDDKVRVVVPSIVENQAQVPVTADARGVEGVQKLVVFADLNPIQHVLTLTPRKAHAFIAFRMKVEQGTPVRAAALTADGVWHVGGVFLNAAGGGCSAPAMARQDEDWSQTVGHARGKLWREVDGSTRVRFRVRHPMDTGLARDNTPSFFIEQLDMRSADGQSLASLELKEPVSEDPTLTMMVRLPVADNALTIDGRDNGGETYRSKIPASWRQSGLTSGLQQHGPSRDSR
ncbi:MAG: quinoprotein dehydrogenase-associated SoxYZ-like carrier [Hyphomicrobiaceae bacterium]|nr:quinoprotein dehydrogenase-associated SoxYZ-like carrier [Hyphomicrobiaceae bacterium]